MKPVIFVHIPKTAGTSLIELVGRNFAADSICRITDVHRSLEEIGSDVEVALAEGKRFICGHFPYAAVSHLRDEARIFTMLRDPVERLVSLYRFWRGQDENAGSEAGQFACRLSRALPFEEFLRCEHPIVVSATRDEMCKALTSQLSQSPDELDPAELYLGAIETLGAMKFGIVEHMPRSLRLLSGALGINLLDQVHLNRSDHLPSPELTRASRELVLSSNMADTMLYRHAARHFAREMAVFEAETLYDRIGAAALTAMQADDRGGHVWDASMPVTGANWNDREQGADGSYWRFTSSPETIIYLPNPYRDRGCTIAIEALFFNRQGFVGKQGRLPNDRCLGFALDGEPVDSHSRPLGESGEVFTINVDPEITGAPFLTLSLRSAYGLSPSVFGSPDKRVLAAAIRSIRISQ